MSARGEVSICAANRERGDPLILASLAEEICFVTIQQSCNHSIPMDYANTKSGNDGKPARTSKTITVGRAADVSPGTCATVDLPDGSELALYNVNGEFHATSNFCPHKGAPLSMGKLDGHVIECDWHGWQFDVRTGQCLTVSDAVEVYRVFVEDGLIKIEI